MSKLLLLLYFYIDSNSTKLVTLFCTLFIAVLVWNLHSFDFNLYNKHK